MEVQENNLVIHPKHYNTEGRKECWDEMIALFGVDAVAIFDCLSAYKYLYRAGEKEGNPAEQDMAKIDNYINHACRILAVAGNANGFPRTVLNKVLKEIENNDKN